MRQLGGHRIAVYCRFSTDRQSPRSIEDQLRVCREYIERAGGAIADDLVFADAGVSGASMVRPGFQALHEAVRSGGVDVVVTEDLSRIGRDIGNNDRTLKQFKSWGARLLAINDGIDTGDKSAKLLGAVKSAMGEVYLDELRDRTKRGMDGLHEAGMWTGGKCYGYRTVPHGDHKRPEIDSSQADVVRRIFAAYVAGKPLRSIAEELNSDGIATARGGKWSHHTLRDMLRNELYTGEVVFNRRRWERDHETGKRRYVERPKSQWRRSHNPDLRIIDQATWDAAKTRIADTAKAIASGMGTNRGYPMSGLLVCGQCGAPMIIAGGGKYYSCAGAKRGHGCTNRRSIREAAIRHWVIDRIRDEVGGGGLLDDMRASWAATLGGRDRAIRAELQQRRAALTATERKLARLLDLVLSDGETPSTRGKRTELEDHAELQRAAIARLEAEAQRVPTIPSVDRMRRFLDHLPDAVMLRPHETRELLREMCAPIECFPPEQKGGDYRVRFELTPDVLAEIETSEPPVMGNSLAVVAGAGYLDGVNDLAVEIEVRLAG